MAASRPVRLGVDGGMLPVTTMDCVLDDGTEGLADAGRHGVDGAVGVWGVVVGAGVRWG